MDTVKLNPNMERNCPQCGTPLATDALGGLCPACLLKEGVADDTVTEGKQPPFQPPTVAELAPLFPQLDILELIGKGGMGAVYKAHQKQLDRFVALKILPPGIGDDPAFAERFAREAKALAKLNHPGIVTLYEFGAVPPSQLSTINSQLPLYFFLMEFVDGVNLRQLLQNSRVSAREALAIVPQICDALQYAHDQGIVHRDIKPDNILMDRRGRVKVADFGLAKIVGTEPLTPSLSPSDGERVAGRPGEGTPVLTDAGKVMGTPQYMSPEQIHAPGEVDHRADIYALGVVFYQMLTGELPGKRLEPPSKKVQIDVRLDEVVLRALEKKPERRYQQVSAMKTQVETIAGDAGGGSIPPIYSDHASSASPVQPALQTPPKVKTIITAPAITMMIVSSMNIVGTLFGLGFLGVLCLVPWVSSSNSFHFNYPGWGGIMPPIFPARASVAVIAVLAAGWMLAWLAAAGVSFVGARRMYQLRRYRLAVASAIIFIVFGLLGLGFNRLASLNSLWSLLEIGVGIWALVVLLRADVKEDFARGKSLEAQRAAPPTPEQADINLARKRVAAPAIGLMVASGLSLLILATGLAVLLFGVSWNSTGGTDTLSMKLPGFAFSSKQTPGPGRPWWTIFGPVLLLILMCPAALTFFGAWRMRQLRSYGLAVTGALLGIITPPGMVLGFIFGLWAIIVLLRRKVRDAFRSGQSSGATSPPKSSAGGAFAIGCGALAALGLLALVVLLLLSRWPMHNTIPPGAQPYGHISFFGLILLVGVVALLVIALVTGLILFLRRKNSSGTGKVLAIGCGVLGLGGIVVGLLLFASFFYFRASKVEESKRVMQARQLAEVEALEARAARQAEIGDGNRVLFKFTHPDKLNGGSELTLNAKDGNNTGWRPQTGQPLTLNGGKSLWFRARVDATTLGSLVALVATSGDQKIWETNHVVLGSGNSSTLLDFTNGLQVSVNLLRKTATRSAAAKIASTTNLTFGPVIEQVIAEPFATDYLWFDLDTSRPVALSNYFKAGFDPEFKAHTEAESRPYQEEFKRLKVASGVDISARLEGVPPDFGKPPALFGLEMAVVPTTPDKWDALTTSELNAALAGKPLKGQLHMEFDPNETATYLFLTREGARGILQITGFTDNPRGVKIRYKLVQNANAPRISLPTKTIVLARATNQLVGTTTNTRTVDVWSDTTLFPGEKFRQITRLPDGETINANAGWFSRYQSGKAGTSTVFNWWFNEADGFGAAEAEAATAQIREHWTQTPLAFEASVPREIFCVTNRHGATLAGRIEFVHTAPQPPDASGQIKATVQIKHFRDSVSIPGIGFMAKVPSGYALRATSNYGEGHIHSPAGPRDYDVTWFPMNYGTRQPSSAKVKWSLQRTPSANAPSRPDEPSEKFEIVLGQPRLILSITNSPDDVFRGFLELVGPERPGKN